MGKKVVMVMVVGFFVIFTPKIILAHESLPVNSAQIATVIQTVEAKGYHDIQEIKFDDDIFKVKAIDADGKEVKLEIDPQKNEITSAKTGEKVESKTGKVTVSILDAVKKVEAAGYQNIYEIKIDDDHYEVKAVDKEGKKTDLKVDGKTGAIINND